MTPALSKEFLDIQATVECGFTLKLVRDMIKTYNQMHRTDKYSQLSSIIKTSLAKWLSVRLRTKWLWIRVPLQSLIGSLYNYYRDELTNDGNDNFNNRNVVNSEAFKYKNKITGNTYNVDAAAQDYDVNRNGTQKIELAIPLKYLGNFWRALNIPLISCQVSLELKWNKNCVITSLEERQVDAGPPVVRNNAPTGATLAINDCKLYIPVVTLSKDNEIKLLTNLKSGFKREIIWNKYRS